MKALVLALLLGCATHKGSTNEPVLSGDPCALHPDEARCTADSACVWAGACMSKSGGGAGGGGGSGQASCVCFNGDVCFEQIGGPAMQTEPQIECAQPAPGSGDPCTRIQNEGTCTDSTTVMGLCICDNGIR